MLQHPVADFGAGKAERAIGTAPVYDAMEAQGDGLYRCRSGNALLFVPPPAAEGAGPLLLVVVFRSVVTRRKAALRRAA